MQRLIVLALIGFAAQLVDGALGMAYGVTSTSLLFLFGIAPSVASASVHMAEVITTAASGVAHIRFGNVDRAVVIRLIIPGSIGAFIGACFLSNLPGDLVKPYIAAFLFILGFYVLGRFLLGNGTERKERNISKRFLTPLGLIAGFVDSTGGGGWGPLTTPILLSRKGLEPRTVVGSVDTSEFAIAVSATLGFLISMGWSNMNWTWVAALMIGGIFAAPIAAWLVRIIPSHLLGVLVGGLIIITNAKTLLKSLEWIPATWHVAIYGALSLLWAGSILLVVLRRLGQKRVPLSE
ncbi:sulfite exporter TauE/SafE family protein [Polycladomyces sp. WAk]|uniref:Probable membrane transporter protein n=1 Tax=Polycladomyces zharkentensis TaxID=2807616 RepID=A0ABS2WLS1_9BACL|nr:sulfite exporter TauE/SafE family protein [Polycladomyces sp. WAk]MBN2910386.1 sulfite exporter TauE/SafE family protein [Polycladomyces sp. WAk]